MPNSNLIWTACLQTFFVAVFLVAGVVVAQEQPIEIQADSMTSMESTKSVVFNGNVDAQQGDVRIRSEKMTIYYADNPEAKGTETKNAQQVEKIICEGKVEVTSEEWLGTSDVMHYFSKQNLIQLIGNAVAFKGKNMVKGERIDYHIDSGQSEVFGSVDVNLGEQTDEDKKPGRVKMTILEQ